MLFNSVQFLIFFPVVTFLYFALPHQFRWFLLLAASCIFYMAFIPVYILILIFTIVIDYIAGIVIENAQGKKRKLFLVISLVSNIGVLFIFKYFNFFNANVTRLAAFLHWNYPIHALSVILPIGLSFHTFQAMSYTIEVYRRKQKAERHAGIYALYVMFYPQLVAGPIERPYNMLHQFHEEHHFEYGRVTNGLKLMTWGFFKKMVIADRLAIIVNQIFNNLHHYEGAHLILAVFFFTFQIYCDFSGYSDVAIGAAQVMGFKLMTNFNRPYFSKSISEFWRRWHISLSSWFRDYLYIPMGGNRVVKWRWYFNLFFTFLLSGLWHGANWTFVIWGSLHGSYLILSLWTQKIRTKFLRMAGLEKYPLLLSAVQVTTTFVLVSFAWIFFRANTLSDALYVVTHLFEGVSMVLKEIAHPGLLLGTLFGAKTGISKQDVLVAAAAIVFMESVHVAQSFGSVREMVSRKPLWLRWSLYYALALSILFFGQYRPQPFIYFQF